MLCSSKFFAGNSLLILKQYNLGNVLILGYTDKKHFLIIYTHPCTTWITCMWWYWIVMLIPIFSLYILVDIPFWWNYVVEIPGWNQVNSYVKILKLLSRAYKTQQNVLGPN